MLITDFDYQLPEELIAQTPPETRGGSRMLFVDKQQGEWQDATFARLPDFLQEGDTLVLNNTKVFPARLLGNSETGAKVEIFLVKRTSENVWETLARPARRLKAGKKIFFGEKLVAEVLEKTDEGRAIVRFQSAENFDSVLDEIGRTPLPPYIKRERDAPDGDRERYQTVFASERGAIAAPTAGLHFTPEILEQIKQRGVNVTEITLHVGYGTFEPVRVSDLSEHTVAPESYEISEETATILNDAKAKNSRIIAVGTTTTRALESAASSANKITAGRGEAALTITPGYIFKIVNGLMTNFHLPQSSLLVLVSTFAGHDLIMRAYNHAVREHYRFYSYGDCMLIL